MEVKKLRAKRYFIYILICVNTIILGACGVKPPYVDPPQGIKHDTFPKTYPDINTDPQVGLERKDL